MLFFNSEKPNGHAGTQQRRERQKNHEFRIYAFYMLNSPPTPAYHHRVTACVNYQAYQFDLPASLTPTAYEKLRTFISRFGENLNPSTIAVLHLSHPLFFIDFPAYGFPYFKVSFYPEVATTRVDDYLRLFENQLHYLTVTG